MLFLLGGICHLIRNQKKDIVYAVIFFAVAVTLKTFVLFIILPVMCYRVKKIPYLVLSGIGILSLYIIEILIYSGSTYFVNEVISPLNGGFLFVALWGMSLNHISAILTIFIIACLYVYYKENADLECFIFVPFVVASMFVAMAQETPGWAVLYIPFLSILIANLDWDNRRLCYLSNMVLSIGVISFMSTRGPYYGESSFGAGLLGKKFFNVSNPYDSVLAHSDKFYTLKIFGQVNSANNQIINYSATVIFAILLFFNYFLSPWRIKKENLENKAEIITRKERFFAYGCLGVSCACYYITVLFWAFMNRHIL